MTLTAFPRVARKLPIHIFLPCSVPGCPLHAKLGTSSGYRFCAHKSCAARCLLVRLVDHYLPHYRLDFVDGSAPNVAFWRGLMLWYAFTAPLSDVCDVLRVVGDVDSVWFCGDIDSRGLNAFLQEMREEKKYACN